MMDDHIETGSWYGDEEEYDNALREEPMMDAKKVEELKAAAQEALDEMYHAIPDGDRFEAFQNAYGRLESALKSIGSLA